MGLTLIYDTETTGLPNWSSPSTDPSQPYITELAAVLVDDDCRIVQQMDTLIHGSFDIPPEITEMTGITEAMCREHGVPAAFAMGQFMSMWHQADIRVAHNQNFDARMIRIELLRILPEEWAETWKQGNAFCTMQASRNVVKAVNSKGTLKMPKLSEALAHFFPNRGPHDAHRAMPDVLACLDIWPHVRPGSVKPDVRPGSVKPVFYLDEFLD